MPWPTVDLVFCHACGRSGAACGADFPRHRQLAPRKSCAWGKQGARPHVPERKARQKTAARVKHADHGGPPAGREHDGCQCHPIGQDLLDHLPVAGLAMRAAADLDGSQAVHEGLRLLARLWVGRLHHQQLPGWDQTLRPAGASDGPARAFFDLGCTFPGRPVEDGLHGPPWPVGGRLLGGVLNKRRQGPEQACLAGA